MTSAERYSSQVHIKPSLNILGGAILLFVSYVVNLFEEA